MRRSSRRRRSYSGVSLRPAWTTLWWRSPSTRSAPVRAMLSSSEPRDSRSTRSWARYWRNPLTRIPSAVSRTKLAPRRQPRRRQIGNRAFIATSRSRGMILADGQLGDVALEEQLDGPVKHHAAPLGQRRQLEHIDRLPYEPGWEAGQLEAAQIGDGGAPAERDHLAQQVEPEGPAWAPAQVGG